MLKWLENYYVGESVRHPKRHQARISAGKMAPGIYLLTVSDNPGNLLEIIPAVLLVQKSVYALCPMIIGMAVGKEEAIDLAAALLTEMYDRTGAFEIEEYLKNR